MTRILLDTHVFMWWVEAGPRVKPEGLGLIIDPVNEILVSAITAFEMETKRRIGKLEFRYDVSTKIREFGFRPLAVEVDHALLAGSLDWEHRDPFDRMLVAQALSDDMVLLSADDAMKSAPGVRVL